MKPPPPSNVGTEMQYFPHLFLKEILTTNDIFTAPMGVRILPRPPTQCNFFSFLMFFYVNLGFEYDYNLPNICPCPPGPPISNSEK